MNFNYEFNYIVDMRASSFFGAADYFFKKYDQNIAVIKRIEDRYLSLPSEFSADHPNVTVTVGEATYDKIAKMLIFKGEKELGVNISEFGAIYTTDSQTISSDESLVFVDNVLATLPLLSSDYLFKAETYHEVSWFYAPKANIAESSFMSSDVPSYQYARLMYHRKIDENFFSLVDSSLEYTSENVATKSRLEIDANHVSSEVLVCNPSSAIGDNYRVDGIGLTINEDIYPSFRIAKVTFHDSYIFLENRPFTFEYGDSLFVRANLDNITSFMLSTALSFSDTPTNGVITKDETEAFRRTFLDRDTLGISDEYSIDVSGGKLAVTYRYLADMISRKIASYFSTQMKLFLGDYSDGGALSELVKYILDKIAELESKFLKNDECAKSRPIRNIDEGCNIDCLTLSFGKTRRMITKQRLKAHIYCALNCKEDTNDWV